MADDRVSGARVRELNDQFRKSPLLHGRAVVTRGVAGNGNDFVARAMIAVEAFSDFTAANDPYGNTTLVRSSSMAKRCFGKSTATRKDRTTRLVRSRLTRPRPLIAYSRSCSPVSIEREPWRRYYHAALFLSSLA
jgi:hypothetical protein